MPTRKSQPTSPAASRPSWSKAALGSKQAEQDALYERLFGEEEGMRLVVETGKRSLARKQRRQNKASLMKTLTATDAKYGFGRLMDLARAEPVAVAKHGHPVVVVMSVEELERLNALEGLRDASSLSGNAKKDAVST